MMPREFMEPIGCSDCGDCVPLKEAQAEIAALESRVVDWIDRAAEIASLRSHLAEAETTIGGLKSFIGEQADQIGTLEIENEALRADLEFMAANSARTSTDYRGRWHVIFRALKSIPYDGTPDDLRRVIREARLRGEG